jgi:hypothetical protein
MDKQQKCRNTEELRHHFEQPHRRKITTTKENENEKKERL